MRSPNKQTSHLFLRERQEINKRDEINFNYKNFG